MKKSNLITVSAAVLLLSAQSAAAQVCTTPPTCDALGYTKSASECGSNPMLKCPLDQSKVFCHILSSSSENTTYRCLNGGVVKILDFTAVINDCASSSKIRVNADKKSSFLCTATGSSVTQVAESTGYGGGVSRCNSAYNLAKQTGLAGCCDYNGKMITPFPPEGNVSNIAYW